jgi:DNA-directed RNA polymerase subunit RPC12/RpoP
MPFVEYDEVEAICADCGRLFRSEDALAAHREESHTGHDEAPTLTCPTCQRKLPSESALRAHRARDHPKE